MCSNEYVVDFWKIVKQTVSLLCSCYRHRTKNRVLCQGFFLDLTASGVKTNSHWSYCTLYCEIDVPMFYIAVWSSCLNLGSPFQIGPITVKDNTIPTDAFPRSSFTQSWRGGECWHSCWPKNLLRQHIAIFPVCLRQREILHCNRHLEQL